MKFITGMINLVVLGSVNATIKIEINNQAIEREANDAARF